MRKGETSCMFVVIKAIARSDNDRPQGQGIKWLPCCILETLHNGRLTSAVKILDGDPILMLCISPDFS